MDTPYDIFRAVCARFRKVQLVPTGFPMSTQHNVNFNEFRFGIDRESEFESFSTLNVKVAGLSFDAHYDSKSADPVTIMDAAAWEAVLAGPFKDREFYIDPRDLSHLKRVLDDEESNTAMAVQLSHSGPPIPGLSLTTHLKTNSWKFFIPAATAEGKAIELAFEIQRERRKQEVERTTRRAALIETMLGKLSQAVGSFAPA